MRRTRGNKRTNSFREIGSTDHRMILAKKICILCSLNKIFFPLFSVFLAFTLALSQSDSLSFHFHVCCLSTISCHSHSDARNRVSYYFVYSNRCPIKIELHIRLKMPPNNDAGHIFISVIRKNAFSRQCMPRLLSVPTNFHSSL